MSYYDHNEEVWLTCLNCGIEMSLYSSYEEESQELECPVCASHSFVRKEEDTEEYFN